MKISDPSFIRATLPCYKPFPFYQKNLNRPPSFFFGGGEGGRSGGGGGELRKLKLPPSTVCLLHVLRLTIKRCHLRCIIVNICLNDGGRAEVVERNKNRLSFYLPSCEFSVSVKKKKKTEKRQKS